MYPSGLISGNIAKAEMTKRTTMTMVACLESTTSTPIKRLKRYRPPIYIEHPTPCISITTHTNHRVHGPGIFAVALSVGSSMASAAICSVTILLLTMAVFASVSSASHPLAAVEATTDHPITKGKGNLLTVHNVHDKEQMEEAKAGGQQGSATEKVMSSMPAQEEGKKSGSYWGITKKLDDDDDSDHDSDSDHDHDHDSDTDHHDQDHDRDHDHDHDSDLDHAHDHDSDGDSNDNDDDHKSKNERKKNHAAQGRKGAPGSKRDDQLPKIVKKV